MSDYRCVMGQFEREVFLKTANRFCKKPSIVNTVLFVQRVFVVTVDTSAVLNSRFTTSSHKLQKDFQLTTNMLFVK